ncbi:MAG: 2-hydroxyacid dehydrogenase [Planctomycetaceae bacterium]|nr:2-hydroxyacid dehydrogenase [Planctomycetaceae bacterium]
MKVAVYNTKPWVECFFWQANANYGHEFVFIYERLSESSARLAKGCQAVCIFVNDNASESVLRRLKEMGVTMIALRCAGFNNVDLVAAEKLGFCVARVPAYSPYAVAEHTIGLILALNRRIHRANQRVREGNFSLDGLLGFDLHGTPVGIIGTGKIGQVVCQILGGFGCQLYAYDPYPNDAVKQLGAQYVSLDEMYAKCLILTLHCPLVPETRYMINADAISKMQPGVMLINTSRGALIDTRAVINGLKSARIGFLGLDVYEEEADLFFEDLSEQIIQDDVFARLLMFPNVIVTTHQGFFTIDAVQGIAETTLSNITAFEHGQCQNTLTSSGVHKPSASAAPAAYVE